MKSFIILLCQLLLVGTAFKSNNGGKHVHVVNFDNVRRNDLNIMPDSFFPNLYLC